MARRYKNINLGAFDNNGSEITFLGKTMEEMQQASAAGEKFGGIFTSKVKEPISNAQSVISNYNMLVQKQCVSQEAINKLTDDMDMKKYLSESERHRRTRYGRIYRCAGYDQRGGKF